MNIKQKIKDAGFSLEEVGQRMPKPMSQQSMSALLREDGNPTINKLRDIANIIGMSLSELVSDDNVNCTQSLTCPHCKKRIELLVK